MPLMTARWCGSSEYLSTVKPQFHCEKIRHCARPQVITLHTYLPKHASVIIIIIIFILLLLLKRLIHVRVIHRFVAGRDRSRPIPCVCSSSGWSKSEPFYLIADIILQKLPGNCRKMVENK